jgi:hypothetical protein
MISRDLVNVLEIAYRTGLRPVRARSKPANSRPMSADRRSAEASALCATEEVDDEHDDENHHESSDTDIHGRAPWLQMLLTTVSYPDAVSSNE